MAARNGHQSVPPDPSPTHSGPGHFRNFPADSRHVSPTHFDMGSSRASTRTPESFRTMDISKMNDARHNWSRIDTFQTPYGHTSRVATSSEGSAEQPPENCVQRNDLVECCNNLRNETSLLRLDFATVADELRTELKREVENLKAELTASSAEMKAELAASSSSMMTAATTVPIEKLQLEIEGIRMVSMKMAEKLENKVEDVRQLSEKVVNQLRRSNDDMCAKMHHNTSALRKDMGQAVKQCLSSSLEEFQKVLHTVKDDRADLVANKVIEELSRGNASVISGVRDAAANVCLAPDQTQRIAADLAPTLAASIAESLDITSKLSKELENRILNVDIEKISQAAADHCSSCMRPAMEELRDIHAHQTDKIVKEALAEHVPKLDMTSLDTAIRPLINEVLKEVQLGTGQLHHLAAKQMESTIDKLHSLNAGHAAESREQLRESVREIHDSVRELHDNQTAKVLKEVQSGNGQLAHLVTEQMQSTLTENLRNVLADHATKDRDQLLEGVREIHTDQTTKLGADLEAIIRQCLESVQKARDDYPALIDGVRRALAKACVNVNPEPLLRAFQEATVQLPHKEDLHHLKSQMRTLQQETVTKHDVQELANTIFSGCRTAIAHIDFLPLLGDLRKLLVDVLSSEVVNIEVPSLVEAIHARMDTTCILEDIRKVLCSDFLKEQFAALSSDIMTSIQKSNLKANTNELLKQILAEQARRSDIADLKGEIQNADSGNGLLDQMNSLGAELVPLLHKTHTMVSDLDVKSQVSSALKEEVVQVDFERFREIIREHSSKVNVPLLLEEIRKIYRQQALNFDFSHLLKHIREIVAEQSRMDGLLEVMEGLRGAQNSAANREDFSLVLQSAAANNKEPLYKIDFSLKRGEVMKLPLGDFCAAATPRSNPSRPLSAPMGSSTAACPDEAKLGARPVGLPSRAFRVLAASRTRRPSDSADEPCSLGRSFG